MAAEGVDEGGRHVRDELHVGLVDLSEAPDGGAVEHEPLGQGLGVEGVSGDREVLHDSRQVAEADVNDPHVLLLDEGLGLCCVLEHGSSVWGGGVPGDKPLRARLRMAQP